MPAPGCGRLAGGLMAAIAQTVGPDAMTGAPGGLQTPAGRRSPSPSAARTSCYPAATRCAGPTRWPPSGRRAEAPTSSRRSSATRSARRPWPGRRSSSAAATQQHRGHDDRRRGGPAPRGPRGHRPASTTRARRSSARCRRATSTSRSSGNARRIPTMTPCWRRRRTWASFSPPIIGEVTLAAVAAGDAFALAPPDWAGSASAATADAPRLPGGVAWYPLAGAPLVRRTWAVWHASSRRRDLAILVAALDIESHRERPPR